MLLTVHLPSVHHIATCCHGNDHSLGDIRLLLLRLEQGLAYREAVASPATPAPEVGVGSEDAVHYDCKSWELHGLHSRVCGCRKLLLPWVFT